MEEGGGERRVVARARPPPWWCLGEKEFGGGVSDNLVVCLMKGRHAPCARERESDRGARARGSESWSEPCGLRRARLRKRKSVRPS